MLRPGLRRPRRDPHRARPGAGAGGDRRLGHAVRHRRASSRPWPAAWTATTPSCRRARDAGGLNPCAPPTGPPAGPRSRPAWTGGTSGPSLFMPTWMSVSCRWTAVRQLAPPERLFFNVNTPDDLVRANTLWRATRIISVIGRKNAGKTTLVVALANEYARRGRRVMTMKHATHPAEADREGTDTWRHFHEGKAERVLIASPAQRIIFERSPDDTDPVTLARRYMDGADIVLAEGFKAYPLPKVEVYRRAVADAPLYEHGAAHADQWVAIVTDDPKFKADCHVLRFHDTIWLQLLANIALGPGEGDMRRAGGPTGRRTASSGAQTPGMPRATARPPACPSVRLSCAHRPHRARSRTPHPRARPPAAACPDAAGRRARRGAGRRHRQSHSIFRPTPIPPWTATPRGPRTCTARARPARSGSGWWSRIAAGQFPSRSIAARANAPGSSPARRFPRAPTASSGRRTPTRAGKRSRSGATGTPG